MTIFLFIGSITSFLLGALIFAGSKSAIHEIEGFQLFLISSVLFTGAAIIDAINKLRK